MATRNIAAHTGRADLELRLTLIDCDVHPHFKDGLNDLMPYLCSSWRRKLGFGPNRAWAKQLGVELTLPQNVLYMNPSGIMRRDTIPSDGAPVWSTPAPPVRI